MSKKSIIQIDLRQCINSFERMKRGGIGIADELVYDTCKRALKYIDELEAKLAESEPVKHGRWICIGDYDENIYECSNCHEIWIFNYGRRNVGTA